MFSEKGLHTYGTSLPLLELDEVPSKKPVYAQDQIATDEQGRRRFHGAFTGGFSAGYWNTVGSKEGWTPQSFKSSRSEKAAGRVTQRPEDFMDDEDRGEFGIAPKGLEIHEDFTGSEHTEQRKRKFLQNDMKPIPGEPVLQQLLKPVKDKVSVRILKAWGWRPGQGLGPRQTRKEKKKARERNKKELYLMEKYGCEMPSTSKPTSAMPNDDDEDDHDDDDDEDDDSDNEDITFAPEDYEAEPYGCKDDSYGIGYKPLSRQSVLGAAPTTSSASSALQKREHINLFKPLEAIGKNNQKISFTGQAFGVGALEEDDDEDVYATDDLTRYDFSLESKKKAKKSSNTIQKEELVFEHFILDLNPEKPPEYKVEMPFGWQPRNWYQKKSRFAPMDARAQRNLERKFADAKREGDDEMTREKRAQLLGEELRKQEDSAEVKSVPQTVLKPSIMELQKQHKERQDKTKSLLEKISAKSSSFTKGGIITLEGEEKSVDSLTAEEISSCFKPFVNDAAKQKRYEEFLAKNLTSEKEIAEFLQTIQPVELSLWDRQMEQKEFVQAKKLYRPLKGIMSDRFVTESEVKAEQKASEVKKDETKQVIVERIKTMWKPHSLLCKRFNIAEPYGGHMEDEKKPRHKPKMSVFDYLETSVNKKVDFQTPVIIPKHIEKPQEIIQQTQEDQRKDDTDSGQQQVSLEWQNVLEGKEKKTPEKAPPTFKPKTVLEKKVVESLDKPITEKKELFKSIFSDSESDGEEDPKSTENNNKNEFVASLSKPISAAAANLLRNNSPPRGIFKALFNAPTATVDLTKEKETSIDLTEENPNKTLETELKEKQNDVQEITKPKEIERILFKPKTSREPKEDNAQMFNSYGPALPNAPPSKLSQPITPSAASLDDKLLTLWQKHKTSAQVAEVWVEKGTSLHSSDSDDDSSTDDSSNTDDDSLKFKKKSKKSKKKKSSDHKHKKHKDHKSSKKSKKSEKKKKKHKKK